MRYADGGGLTVRERVARGAGAAAGRGDVRPGLPTSEIAARLRVTPKSVRAWRRAWTAGGRAGLASRGPGGVVCKLSDAQLDRLVAELDRGPAAQDWAAGRGISGGPWPDCDADRPAVPVGLHPTEGRICCTGSAGAPVPARRAIERDEDAIAAWRTDDLGEDTRLAAEQGRGSFRRRGRPDLAPTPGRTLGSLAIVADASLTPERAAPAPALAGQQGRCGYGPRLPLLSNMTSRPVFDGRARDAVPVVRAHGVDAADGGRACCDAPDVVVKMGHPISVRQAGRSPVSRGPTR